MRKNYLRTMLVAIGLAMGCASVGAQTTTQAKVKMTYVNGTSGETDTSYGEIATGETATTGYNKISGGSVTFTVPKWNVNYITYIQVDASEIEGKLISASLTADFSGSTDSKRVGTYGVGYNSSAWSSTMTYNTADKSIKTLGLTQATTSKSNSTFNSKTFDITDALKDDEDKIVTILVYATNAGGGLIKNPAVTITYSKEQLYTVTFVESNNLQPSITVYTDEKHQNSIDANTLSANTTYYYTATLEGYKDYNGSFQVGAENPTVTFTMEEKEKFAYSVNLVDESGNVLKSVYTNDKAYEGLNISYSYPKYLTDNEGKVTYVCAENTFTSSKTIENEGYTTIVYTPYNGVAYFIEAEDSIKATTVSNLNYSNGQAVRAFSEKNLYTIPQSGIYKLTYATCSNNTNQKEITLSFYIGEKEIDTKTVNWSYNYIKNNGTITTEAITLTANDIITVKASNSNIILDYILLEKIADIATVSEAGYATYVPTSNVTRPENATAYTVKVNNNKITLNRIESTVLKANQGFLIAGEPTTYTFNFTDETADILDNDLKAATENMTATGTQYALAVLSSGKVGFAKVKAGETIPAGKAYLEVSESEAKNAFFVIGNETTAIKDINAQKDNTDGTYYSLQGVKTNKPAQGLYIHNGKKVIIK